MDKGISDPIKGTNENLLNGILDDPKEEGNYVKTTEDKSPTTQAVLIDNGTDSCSIGGTDGVQYG